MYSDDMIHAELTKEDLKKLPIFDLKKDSLHKVKSNSELEIFFYVNSENGGIKVLLAYESTPKFDKGLFSPYAKRKAIEQAGIKHPNLLIDEITNEPELQEVVVSSDPWLKCQNTEVLATFIESVEEELLDEATSILKKEALKFSF